MTTSSILPGTVYPASPYLAGFDQTTKLTGDAPRSYYDAGYRFCLRYLTLGAERSQDLTTDEASLILAAGLALMPVQHVDRYGWSPTSSLGRSHGNAAVADARSVGIPPGVCVWLDLEGVATGTASSAVVAYCQAWYAAVAAAAYAPGIYVGPNSGLDSTQLSDLAFEHYWSSASSRLPTPTRGFQMFQGLVEDGRFDPDYVVTDARGGQAQWLATAAAVYPTLRAGNTSPSDPVRCLQRALKANGAQLDIDGLFGPGTTSAVEAFQTGAGLPATGVADDPTWQRLVARTTSGATA